MNDDSVTAKQEDSAGVGLSDAQQSAAIDFTKFEVDVDHWAARRAFQSIPVYAESFAETLNEEQSRSFRLYEMSIRNTLNAIAVLALRRAPPEKGIGLEPEAVAEGEEN